MSDLISREAVDAYLTSIDDALVAARFGEQFTDQIDAALEKLRALDVPTVTPTVVINISGGLMQGASSTHKLDVVTLDFDTDSFSDDSIGVEIDGSNAYRNTEDALIDPEFVAEVREAELIYFHDGSPVE